MSYVLSPVCLFVTFRYADHIGWNTSKIISRLISLRFLLGLTPNIGDLVQREHLQNSLEFRTVIVIVSSCHNFCIFAYLHCYMIIYSKVIIFYFISQSQDIEQ